ncbi:MAG: PAS domain S-box protein [Phycisphaeraceae bacterium]|nr:PAS domain S-box protein [Phycisphaeraceae bacterium]
MNRSAVRISRASPRRMRPGGRRGVPGGIRESAATRRGPDADSRAFFEGLFERSPAPQLLIDPDSGRFVRVNSAANDFYGFEANQLVGMPASAVCVEDRAMVERMIHQSIRGDLRWAEMHHRMADGSTRQVEVLGTPIVMNQHTLLHVQVHDISEKKRLERANIQTLEQQVHAQNRAIKTLENLLGVVGHELRTPLCAIRATCELLLGRDPDEAVSWDEHLRTMHGQVVVVANMLHQMLDAARLHNGRMNWNWKVFSLEELVIETMEGIRVLPRAAGVTLDAFVAPEGLQMTGDRNGIQRLMTNLLSNAVRHTDQGSIDLMVTGEDRNGEPWIRIAVHDTGRGIPEEMRDRLGRPFMIQGDDDRGGAMLGGTGLGLSICRAIAAAHAGTIYVSSRCGSGTTFTVEMPAMRCLPSDETVDLPILWEEC